MNQLICQSIFFIVFIFLSGCSSSGKKSSGQGKFSREDLQLLEKVNFSKNVLITLDENSDRYSENVSIIDLLSKESLSKVRAEKLKDLKSEMQDPFTRSIYLCYTGEFERAFQVYDEIYLKYKNHPGYWNNLGTCYLLKSEFGKAHLFYKKALGFGEYPPAINNIGVLYERKQEYQKALLAFEKASLKNSNFLTPRFNAAVLKLRFGLLKDACNEFNIIYNRRKSDDPDLLYSLGTCNLFQGKVSEGIEFYSKINDEIRNNPEYGLNYSIGLFLGGRKEDARKAFLGIGKKKLKGFESYYKEIGKYLEVL